MKKLATTVVAVVAMVVGSAGMLVQAAGPAPANRPVTITFATPPDGAAYAFQNVGSYVYSNGETVNGAVAVEAWLDGTSGRLLFNTCFILKKGSTNCGTRGRTLSFGFSDRFDSTASGPSYTAPATVNVWTATDQSGNALNGSLLSVASNQVVLGRMLANFTVASGSTYTAYAMRFTPEFFPQPNPVAYVMVTRTSATTWTVESYPALSDSDDGDVAALVAGNNSVDYGRYHVPFKFTITLK